MEEQNKILIVDDEADLREILQFNLESEGYSVDTAESAEQALKKLSPAHKLILLDVMMGGMSGFKMAEKLRKELHNNIPIIFLTAKDTENDMLTGFSIGGDDYISKPFSIKEVSARVKAVLKRSKNDIENTSPIITVGEITLDLNTKCVTANGQLLPITKKEFEILCLLAQNPGHIFSREDILNRIWQNDGYVLERTVDVHITRLRKKLGVLGKHIVNRSGYGYCIEF
ncbi:MAG: response regulator transcription factor [Marinifilaceae bacterium]|nr:response regulator transcription factor [Marinifilaceae bacterium]